MFPRLPQYFRKHNLDADVRTLLLLQKCMDKGLIRTLGDMYNILKGIVTNDPKDYGPFTSAFYEYFLDVQIKKGERLESAIVRSETFKEWVDTFDWENEEMPDVKVLVDRFLDEVHISSYDIQRMLDGKEILEKDNPGLEDTEGPDDPQRRNVTEGADYSDISTEELLRRMEEVAKQQRRRHSGGSHWIGTGGKSPYGAGGAAAGGIRVGGSSGGRMARKVIGDPNFFPVDTKVPLSDNNIDVALASLKGIEEESTEQLLDVPNTIKEGLKQGGIFLPIEKEKLEKKIRVLLLIDNGGWSMTPYVRMVTKLFSKMKTRFAHDMKSYYFHNTLYDGAYTDVIRRNFDSIDKICSLDKEYSVFILGDADMSPYEVTERSMATWIQLKDHFKNIVWLNPLNQNYWASADTVPYFMQVFDMYPLTPEGIEKAVLKMNKKK